MRCVFVCVCVQCLRERGARLCDVRIGLIVIGEFNDVLIRVRIVLGRRVLLVYIFMCRRRTSQFSTLEATIA